MTKQVDFIYIEGEGDIVAALQDWDQTQSSQTTSGELPTVAAQVFDFCRQQRFNALAISYFQQHKRYTASNGFAAYSKPKLELSGGLGFHFSQILFGLRVLLIGLRYRPKHIHFTYNIAHLFVLAPLTLLGIKLVPHFHDLLWASAPSGMGKIQQCFLQLDAWFLTKIAHAALVKSPAISAQLSSLTTNKGCPSYVFNLSDSTASAQHLSATLAKTLL